MSARAASVGLLPLSLLACTSSATLGQLMSSDASMPEGPAVEAGADEPSPPNSPGPDAAAADDDAASEDAGAADAEAGSPLADASRDAWSPDASRGCLEDPDCPSGRICAGGTCVQCVTDTDCLGAEERRCDSLGRCVECVSTDQCTGERVCAPWGECELSCTRDVQCLGALRCDAVAGVCLECHADADCTTSGEFCDEGVCARCAFNTDCPN